MNFLYYILHENKSSMIRLVYDALKEDSCSGDFKSLTDKDKKELEIEYTDEDIENIGKVAWKKFIKERVTFAAFKFLIAENAQKKKQNTSNLMNSK